MHRRTILPSVALVAGVSALAPADGADAAPTGKFSATKLRAPDSISWSGFLASGVPAPCPPDERVAQTPAVAVSERRLNQPPELTWSQWARGTRTPTSRMKGQTGFALC